MRLIKKAEQKRLVDLLEEAITKQQRFIDRLEGFENPQIQVLIAYCKGEVDAFTAALSAIRDNNWTLLRFMEWEESTAEQIESN